MFNFNELVNHIRSVFPKHDASFSKFLEVERFTLNTDGTGSAVLLNASPSDSDGLITFREQRHYYENNIVSITNLGDTDYVELRYHVSFTTTVKTLRLVLSRDHDYTQGTEPSEPFKIQGYTGPYAAILNGEHSIIKVHDSRTLDIVSNKEGGYDGLPIGGIPPNGAYTLAYIEILKDTVNGKITVSQKSYDHTNRKLTLNLTGFKPRTSPLNLRNTKYELGSDIYLMDTNQNWVNAIVSGDKSRRIMFVVPLDAQGVMENTLAPEMINMGATQNGQYGRYRIKHTFSVLVFLPSKTTNFHTQNLQYCYLDLMKALSKTLLGYGQSYDEFSTIAAVTLSRHGMVDSDSLSYQHEYIFTVTTELSDNVNISDRLTSSYIESGISLREFSGDLIVDGTQQDVGDFGVSVTLP